MKELAWSSILSVDVDEIDDDHRRLLELFNILNHSVADGDAAEYLGAVLEELINCTIWHFSHEERLMLKHGYPGTAEHKADHQELVESVRELQQKICQSGCDIGEDELHFLERWLTEHILTTDRKLGSFLAEVM